MPHGSFTLDTINIFSPNRNILQLFLKGIRICSSIDIGDEHNYADENIFTHSNIDSDVHNYIDENMDFHSNASD